MPFTEKYIRPLAVAVIRYQGKILAVRGVDHVKNEVFFRLPGGGIEFRRNGGSGFETGICRGVRG